MYGNGYKYKYLYDAWGNCKIVDSSGGDITNSDSVAQLNPFRWKSQYYDSDSKLYFIGQRWYDPERSRYISSASPEMLLQNAGVVFALNLYAFCVSNPVAVLIAMCNYQASLDFYFNGDYESWWDAWGKWVFFGIVGVAATVLACVFSGPCGAAATAATVIATLGKIAAATLIGAAIGLAIGGTIAGIMSAVTGHGFWQGFEDHVSENWVETLVTSFAFAAVSVAATNVIGHFQCFKEGTLVETENGLKPIEEIEVGDKVLAYNEDTGEQAYKKVVRLFRNQTEEWCTVKVKPENGQETFEIVSTPGHKYYLPDNIQNRDLGKHLEYIGYAELSKKWVSAESLKNGDRVLLFDGTYGIIQSVKVNKLTKLETTYNFEVEDFHTYYVGKQRVLVHNANCVKTPDGKDVYRGGNDMTLKQGEYRLDSNGLVKTTHGVSVNTDAGAVAKFGGAYKVQSLPDGLKIIQRGKNLMHFEIVPQYAMPLNQYQSLLYQVQLIPV